MKKAQQGISGWRGYDLTKTFIELRDVVDKQYRDAKQRLNDPVFDKFFVDEQLAKSANEASPNIIFFMGCFFICCISIDF